ncbi:MAG: hypothetical protein A3G24_06810 [Betaproteobacteria bacterium RIFCSPLOWO2_12_FULL_62_13]|nr:MAG: hypothetical protein A3G24_06810 [Betaproteobacteria bacterium RIFCSPLOWO2_12_FULL_62_13]
MPRHVIDTDLQPRGHLLALELHRASFRPRRPVLRNILELTRYACRHEMGKVAGKPRVAQNAFELGGEISHQAA